MSQKEVPLLEQWWPEPEKIQRLKTKLYRLENIRDRAVDNRELKQTIIDTEKKLKKLEELQYDCFMLQTNTPFLFALYKKEKLPTYSFFQHDKKKGELDDVESFCDFYLTTGMKKYREAETACIRRGIGEYLSTQFDFARYIKITQLGKKFVENRRSLTSDMFFTTHPDLNFPRSNLF